MGMRHHHGGGRDEKERKVQMKTFTRLFAYITPFWELKAVLLLVTITTGLSILSPAIIGSIIDLVRDVAAGNPLETGKGIEQFTSSILFPVSIWVTSFTNMNGNMALLFVSSLSLVVLAILDGILNYAQRYLTSIISQRAGYDMRNDMYNSLLDQSFSFYDHQRTGQLMARATGDVNMLGRFFGFGFRMMLSSGLLLILVIYSMVTLNLQLTLISITVLPFLLMTTLYYSRTVSPMWRELREQYGDITSVYQESLSGIRVIKGFSNEEHEEEKFRKVAQKYFDMNIALARLRSFFMPLATFLSSIGLVIVLWYGGTQVIQGTISLGAIVAFYFYFARLMGPVRLLGFMTSMFVRANAAAERVFEIIDAEVEVKDKEDAEVLETVNGHIVFEDVYFSYDKKNMVLKDINIDVKQGQTIAILGATGSGKSSIINLIPRFYDVSKGSIKIDGKDLRDITIKSLRKQIGIVRQDPFIFSTTLKENIAYGVENYTMDMVRKAAKQAKIHKFISGLPEQYETRVGERGVTLSGGQKQRTAIARALLKNPKILILDDSTSSVDTQTEYEIQQALDALLEDRTTFIITQRLSSIKKADYIIVLDDGFIAEQGPHEELMDLNGIYRKLYETQIGGGQEEV